MAFYPCGSWLENEQAKDTPAGFEYAVMPLPERDRRRTSCPATAIYAAAGEMYFVASKGKNPQGGMEYLRHMLSKEAARASPSSPRSLTVVQGAADGLTISPGLTSANELLERGRQGLSSATAVDTWYKKLDDEARAATNELMFKGGTADEVLRPDGEGRPGGRQGLLDHEVHPLLIAVTEGQDAMRHGKYPFIIGFLVVPVALYAIFVIAAYVQTFQLSLTDWSGLSGRSATSASTTS